MATTSYVDLGASQRIESGTPTAKTSYVDLGAMQRPEGIAGSILYPSLFTDTDTFFAPTVTPETVTLTPSLFSDADALYSPTVTLGDVTLSPSLFTDSDTFYAATITPGSVTLTPALFTDTDIFYAVTVTSSITISPALFADADTFYAPVVTPGSVTLSPALFTDPDTFYAPTVTIVAQVLSPTLFSDPDTFYSAIITTGSVTLVASLFNPGDIFHSPRVSNNLEMLTGIVLPMNLQLSRVPVNPPANLEVQLTDIHTAIYALAAAICNQEFWIDVTFAGTWVNYGSTYAPTSYHKDITGRVWLRGIAKLGTSGSTIFTLPVGYRPARMQTFAIITDTGVGRIDISNDGTVTHISGGVAQVPLDNISFLIK